MKGYKRPKKFQLIGLLIAEWVDDPNINLTLLAKKYGFAMWQASRFISKYWLYNQPKNPVTITIQSKLNDMG